MFKKKDSVDPESFDTLIGQNTTIEGNIESEGTVRIDGKIKGDIKVTGNVFVGASAVVKGSIFANDVHVSGTVDGNVHSKGVLRLHSTARLNGDIQVHSFIADEGGYFNGKCSMLDGTQDHIEEPVREKSSVKKSNSSREYKKSTVISQIYEDKEKNGELESL